MEEIWRDIPDFEGFYQASDQGRIRSLDRTIDNGKGGTQRRRGKIQSTRVTGISGHLSTSLCKYGKSTSPIVHTLILLTFIGPRPDGMFGCHNDGNPTNNHIDNLRWDTAQNNTLDSVRHGTHFEANKTHCDSGHKFTKENTHIRSTGKRDCKECGKLRARGYRAKKKLDLFDVKGSV